MIDARWLIVGKILLAVSGVGLVAYGGYLGYQAIQSKLPDWKKKWSEMTSKFTDPFGLKKKKEESAAALQNAKTTATQVMANLPRVSAPQIDWNKAGAQANTTLNNMISSGTSTFNNLLKSGTTIGSDLLKGSTSTVNNLINRSTTTRPPMTLANPLDPKTWSGLTQMFTPKASNANINTQSTSKPNLTLPKANIDLKNFKLPKLW